MVVALCVLATWIACAMILVGLGSLVLRGLTSSFHFTDAFWTGLVASVAFLEIWSLVFAVNSVADGLLALAGAVGLCINMDWLAQKVAETRCSKPKFAIYAVIVSVIALRAAGPCEHYDTGLYGAQAVRWMTSYPAIFGLANVHARLGLNTSVFLCHAALNQGPWKDLYFHLFPGLLICALWIPILGAVSRVIRQDSVLTSDWFYIILLIPTNWWSTRGDVVGTTTDEPAAIVALVASGILFQWFQDRDQESASSAAWDSRLFTGATLLLLSVTFKLSIVVFAVMALGIIIVIIWRLEGRSGFLRPVYAAFVLLLVPWLARGIITSGYPFFPSTTFAFPVEWRVHSRYAQVNALMIQSWARIAGALPAQTRGLAWLHPWVHDAVRNRPAFQVPVAIALLGAPAILLLRSRCSKPLRLSALWLLFPSITGLLFWFLEAPGLRFASAMIWTTAATVGALGFAISSEVLKPQLPRVFAGGIFLATLWCGFGWPHSYKIIKSVHGFVALPVAPVAARQAQSGLVVYVPIRGNQCWNATIPCTPYFSQTLRLRQPFDFRRGFTSEGLPPQIF
jgi:hypothetical protein